MSTAATAISATESEAGVRAWGLPATIRMARVSQLIPNVANCKLQVYSYSYDWDLGCDDPTCSLERDSP